MHEKIDEIKLFEQYLSYGGFPGLLNYENEEKQDGKKFKKNEKRYSSEPEVMLIWCWVKI